MVSKGRIVGAIFVAAQTLTFSGPNRAWASGSMAFPAVFAVVASSEGTHRSIKESQPISVVFLCEGVAPDIHSARAALQNASTAIQISCDPDLWQTIISRGDVLYLKPTHYDGLSPNSEVVEWTTYHVKGVLKL